MTSQPAPDSPPPSANGEAGRSRVPGRASTTLRFWLLLVAVGSAATILYGQAHDLIHAGTNSRLLRACEAEQDRAITSALDRLPGTPFGDRLMALLGAVMAVVGEAGAAFVACSAPVTNGRLAWAAAGAVLVLGVAALLYWFGPGWWLRSIDERLPHNGLVARAARYLGGMLIIPPTGLRPASVAVRQPIDALIGHHQLRPPDHLVWAPLNTDALHAAAAGRRGQTILVVPSGLVMLRLDQPDQFEAIVLHELAHLASGDIDHTTGSLALTWCFTALVAVPMVALVVATPFLGANPAMAIDLVARLVVVAAVVWLLRRAILRVREFDADAQAARWLGSPKALDAVLASAEGIPGDPAWLGRLPAWSRPVVAWLNRPRRSHPSVDSRRHLLAEPARLGRLEGGEALATGAVAGLALPLLEYPLRLILRPLAYRLAGEAGWDPVTLTVTPLLTPLLPPLVTILPAFLVVGLGVWHQLTRLAEGAGTRHLQVGWGAGVAVGLAASLDTAVLRTEYPGLDGSPWVVVALFIGYGVIGLIGAGLVGWLSTGLRLNAGDGTGRTSPWPLLVVGGVLAALIVGYARFWMLQVLSVAATWPIWDVLLLGFQDYLARTLNLAGVDRPASIALVLATHAIPVALVLLILGFAPLVHGWRRVARALFARPWALVGRSLVVVVVAVASAGVTGIAVVVALTLTGVFQPAVAVAQRTASEVLAIQLTFAAIVGAAEVGVVAAMAIWVRRWVIYQALPVALSVGALVALMLLSGALAGLAAMGPVMVALPILIPLGLGTMLATPPVLVVATLVGAIGALRRLLVRPVRQPDAPAR